MSNVTKLISKQQPKVGYNQRYFISQLFFNTDMATTAMTEQPCRLKYC